MALPENSAVTPSSGGAVRFLKEAKSELKKVTWPTKPELIANTIVVIIAVLLCAILIWMIDSFFSVVIRMLLGS